MVKREDGERVVKKTEQRSGEGVCALTLSCHQLTFFYRRCREELHPEWPERIHPIPCRDQHPARTCKHTPTPTITHLKPDTYTYTGLYCVWRTNLFMFHWLFKLQKSTHLLILSFHLIHSLHAAKERVVEVFNDPEGVPGTSDHTAQTCKHTTNINTTCWEF